MKRIALLGMPNTGKSTLFNRMTGGAARVGNWPGITVELLSGRILLGDDMVEIIDLPGIYDLHGFSDDEQVVRHFLHDNVPDLALVILNTTQIERQMSLLLQLKQLDINLVVMLNMADEAKKFGISVDAAKMSALLELPIFLLSAKYGSGYPEALQAVAKALRYPTPGMAEHLRSQLEQDEHIEAEMARVLKHTVQVPAQLSDNLTEKLDSVMLHPWLGLPIFFAVMYLLFQGIFIFGQPLQTGIAAAFTWLRETALVPLLGGLPHAFQGLLLDGIYNGVATVAAFVPIIVLFFLFMAMVEDSGYLSRAAFLMDALMARLGLDGRGFVMLLMGFGCNVPALMGTRVMRSRAMRLLTMLVIPFSLCSARLQVFIFFTAALFSAKAAPVVLFSLYLFSFAAAITHRADLQEPLQEQRAVRAGTAALPFPHAAPDGAARLGGSAPLPAPRHQVHRRRRGDGVAAHPSAAVRSAGKHRYLCRHDRRRAASVVRADRHQRTTHHRADLRLHRQGDRDRRARGDLRIGRRCAERRHGSPARLGPGLQLHAVHPALHALPGHRRHTAKRIQTDPLHRAVTCLVAGTGVAGELRVLSGREVVGVLSRYLVKQRLPAIAFQTLRNRQSAAKFITS